MPITGESNIKAPDKNVPCYTSEIHNLNSPARTLLENYSKISPDQVISHILAIVSLRPSAPFLALSRF